MIRRGHCVHFNGMQNDACHAGVRYDTFGPNERRACRAPCLQEYRAHENVDGTTVTVWKPWHRDPGEEMVCAQRRMPTEQEIAEGDAEMVRLMDRMRTVMAVVSTWRTWSKKNRVGKQEVIECPSCKGRLHLSQAAYNGHVWGKCETDGCVSWLE